MASRLPSVAWSDRNIENKTVTEDYAMASVGSYLLFVWRRAITMTGAHAYLHVARKLEQTNPPTRLSVFVMFGEGCAGEHPTDVRELLGESLRGREPRAAAIVIPHSGFAAAGMRAVVGSVRAQGGATHALRIFQSVEPAMTWLAAPEPAEFVRALVELVDTLKRQRVSMVD